MTPPKAASSRKLHGSYPGSRNNPMISRPTSAEAALDLFGVEGIFNPVDVISIVRLLLDQQCIKAQRMIGETLVRSEVEEGGLDYLALLTMGNCVSGTAK